MEQLSYSILFYLHDTAKNSSQAEPFRYVTSSEICTHLYNQTGFYYANTPEYLHALDDLLQNEYIEQRVETYLITFRGKEFVNLCMHPEQDLTNQGIMEQRKSNQILIVIMAIAIIFFLLFYFRTHAPVIDGGTGGLPPSQVYRQMQVIPLEAATARDGGALEFSRLGEWFDESPGSSNNSIMPVPLTKDSVVLEIDSQYSGNPFFIFLPVDISGAVQLHLLMNLSYGSSDYTGGIALEGVDVARIWLFFEEGGQYSYDLTAGKDIREWVFAHPNVVHQVDSHVTRVWRAHHIDSREDAAIDDIQLEIPAEWSNSKIKYIGIEDRSKEVFNSPDPGMMVFGVAIEYLR